MLTAPQTNLITENEYLEGERLSDVKHELIDGYAYAMAGTSRNHERIASNINAAFNLYLKKSPCEPFGSDMKVKAGSNFFYPDVSVVCDDTDGNDYYTESPVIIVEVLSKSTRRTDQTIKRQNYLRIPSLQEYLLIEQDIVDIEILRRENGWRSTRYYMGDELTLDSIGLILLVEDIYHRVKNDDVAEYLAKKEEEARQAEEALSQENA